MFHIIVILQPCLIQIEETENNTIRLPNHARCRCSGGATNLNASYSGWIDWNKRTKWTALWMNFSERNHERLLVNKQVRIVLASSTCLTWLSLLLSPSP